MLIQFDAPPTGGRMMASNAFGRLIAGPVGSGKTTTCIFELFRRSAEQAPAPDGFRYTRWAIVRQTLSQLTMTVLKDILQWLPKLATYKVTEKTIHIQIGDIRSEWILIPLEDPEDQQRLLSSQLTGAWMSEAIEIDVDLVAAISGRCGRYPNALMGGATWFGMIADTNFPAENSPWWKFMELDTPPDWQIFKQPGGMEADAENLPWLLQTPDTLVLPLDHPDRLARGHAYYERLARNKNPDWVRRYVHAEYGNDPSGIAVFRECFRVAKHTYPAREEPGHDVLLPVHGMPLIIGQDFGRDPCSIICQLDHKGRMLVLQEVIAEDIGLEQHINTALRPALLQPRFVGRPFIMIGDPAGNQRSSIYEETTFDVLRRTGFAAYPAPSNAIPARLRAIEAFLLMTDGMLIDRQNCPTIINGMSGGYRFAKTRGGVRKPLPEKNEYSHPMDALQYACLAAHGGLTNYIAGRGMRAQQRAERVVRPSAAGWT